MALPVTVAQGAESRGNITLAVTTTGNDSDPTRPARIVQGDWSAKPFLTIQAALDVLPLSLRSNHTINVNVAAGMFAGFIVRGMFDGSSNLSGVNITGTRQTATPTTGPASGTATSGSSRTLVLTGAGWTPDDLIGKFLYITSGPGAGLILPIAKNDTDTITVSRIASPSLGAGSVFTIQDLATIINSANSNGSFGVSIYDCVGGRVTVTDVKVECSVFSGFQTYRILAAGFIRCVATGTATTAFNLASSTQAFTSNCVAMGTFTYGFTTQGNMYLTMSGMLAHGVTYGLTVNEGVSWMFPSSPYFSNCTYGLWMAGSFATLSSAIFDACGTAIKMTRSVLYLSTSEIKNTTSRTTNLTLSNLELGSSLSGTGNADFGLNASGSGNTVECTGFTPTITGTLGEVTVDGFTDETWAALSSPGDYALDLATGSRVNRR